jgi:hypothetical protein
MLAFNFFINCLQTPVVEADSEAEESEFCQLEVFKDALFRHQVTRFPFTTTSTEGIFLKTSSPAGELILFFKLQ